MTAKGFKRERRINDLIQTTLAEIIQREAKDLRFGIGYADGSERDA